MRRLCMTLVLITLVAGCAGALPTAPSTTPVQSTKDTPEDTPVYVGDIDPEVQRDLCEQYRRGEIVFIRSPHCDGTPLVLNDTTADWLCREAQLNGRITNCPVRKQHHE